MATRWTMLSTLPATLLAALAATLVAAPSPAAEGGVDAALASGYDLVGELMSSRRADRRRAARGVVERGNVGLAPGIVDALFFMPPAIRDEAEEALASLLGEDPGGYWDWVELVGRRTDLRPAPGYLAWKRTLLERIDPRYRAVLYDGAPLRIRLEEVVFGGVPLGGIPALEGPRRVTAAEARYLEDEERVFGVDLGGEQVAYPHRFLSWHEMLNDEVGGVPVALSYCTLCGSGVLWSRARPSGAAFTFGTSGLLYRSNKLMFDRETFTLWSNLTGEPVVGRLAGGQTRLEMLPVTVTTWREWRDRHPTTQAMALDRSLAWRPEVDYRPGRADAARRGVAFPVWLASDALPPQEEVFALRLAGAARAYPVDRLVDTPVVNDELAGQGVLLLTDPTSRAVRAYARRDHYLRPTDDPNHLEGAAGLTWRVEETSLVPLTDDASVDPLPRLPGHLAFWFGWYGAFPETELWTGAGDDQRM